MNSDGTDLKLIANPGNGVVFNSPCWSPDGKQIAFICALADGSAKCYLYMLNADGTNLHKVIDDPTIWSCTWIR